MSERPIKYYFSTMATDVREEFKKVHVSGTGPEAIFRDDPIGWFVFLQGSGEGLYLGPDKPDISKGDIVYVTIERKG